MTLEVKSGEFVSLLGPSGCGKSTTLNMIAGLLEPTSGKIFVGDQEITDVSPIQRNVGLVFQNYAVFNNMTVYENLAFGLRVRKMPNDQIRSEVNKIAETLELSDILAMKAGKLRLDELQRTALGRSMITKPAFFLLDEPLSNLDAGLRSQMRVELKRIQRELEQTILYVTHDQVEAMSMADRIADYAKTNFPGEDMVGTAKATFVLETLPELQEKGYSVDILKPYVNTKKEVKLKKLTPNKVYFDVATQTPLFFDGTGLKPIE